MRHVGGIVMKRKGVLPVFVLIIFSVAAVCCQMREVHCQNLGDNQMKDSIQLPSPRHKSNTSVEQALLSRRSIRKYKDEPLSLAEIAQILWAAQGINERDGESSAFWRRGRLRTAPSAGALYPLEIYVVAGEVGGLEKGIYRYIPQRNSLKKVQEGDGRTSLSKAALGQSWVKNAPSVLVISGVYERTSAKYGERAERYVPMEAGAVAQNIYLQAVSLGLGTVVVGAFKDQDVKKVLDLPKGEYPLALMPLGKKME